ncbi:MAG TPA: hydantoinase B/oxoprolinase family protein [Pseudobdellovibrionaceae bacterium]|jgi:N-methylhydantoinase B
MLSNWIYEFADLFLKTEKSAALLSSDGDIIQAKSDLTFEITGFKSIVDTSLKYIALKPGEILITNDSYCGGSFLHRYTFLMPLSRATASQPGLFICVRREFAPGLNISDKVDNEGLRIPPTPIFQNGQLVTPIIEAMAMHPLCPQGFNLWLQKTVTDLGQLYTKWNQIEKNCKFQISALELKKFLSFSKKFATEKILEKAQGEARSEVRLDSGEVLKLHLEINNGLIKADFSGTTTGIKNHLPDLATFGACYQAVAHFYGLNEFNNSGGFSVLQVVTPLGCFLNAKYPASTHQGFQTGVAAVQLATTLALHEIVKNPQAILAETDLKMEISFSQGSRWLSLWSAKLCCESISLEQIESQYPIQFIKLEKDTEKMHLQVEFKALAPCQIRWLSDFTKYPIKALRNGLKAPEPALVEMMNQENEWIALASQGNLDLIPGTHLRLNIWSLFT